MRITLLTLKLAVNNLNRKTYHRKLSFYFFRARVGVVGTGIVVDSGRFRGRGRVLLGRRFSHGLERQFKPCLLCTARHTSSLLTQGLECVPSFLEIDIVCTTLNGIYAIECGTYV